MIAAFALLFYAFILNACAAGIAATLYLSREGMGNSIRAIWASLLTGVANAAVFGVFVAEEVESLRMLILVLGFLILTGFAASLPASWMMSRRIEGSRQVGDTFR